MSLYDQKTFEKANIIIVHLSRSYYILSGDRAYSIPMVRRCRCRPSTISNIFSSETTWSIKAKFHVEPPWEGDPGHMTKMAATPIYGKNLLQNRKSYDPET